MGTLFEVILVYILVSAVYVQTPCIEISTYFLAQSNKQTKSNCTLLSTYLHIYKIACLIASRLI